MPAITPGKITDQPHYLPITAEELKNTGKSTPDIILVSADAYVDHPSFAAALLGRTLINAGFSVAIISQPDWKEREGKDFARFGKPNLFFAVLPGAVDPMVSAYTPALRRRHDDAYSPGGKLTRPEKTTLVYTNILHRLFKDTPIIIGGIEASLRRFAHYDYWSDSVKQGILADAPASLLVYGMGELQMIEIAARLKNGEEIKDLTDIRGTSYTISIAEFREHPPTGIILPAYPAVVNKETYAETFKIQYLSKDTLIQPHPKTVIVQNPPARPLTSEELDIIYELPYTRKQHPAYKEPIPALTPIQFSITTHRGCFGACSFCAITHHQGKEIVSRSEASILREAERIAKMPEFKGTISDLGGPSANMYACSCAKWEKNGPCLDKNCTTCPSMKLGTAEQISLLRNVSEIRKVKHVFISSGVRYDLIPKTEEGDRYLRELTERHISGHLKVAPEHISDRVTQLMNKPGKAVFDAFCKRFDALQKDKLKRQYLVPYLMSSHPGCRIDDMVTLALYLREKGMYTEQVQDFTPVPMTLSTAMYYTGIHPLTGKKVYVPLGDEKRIQRALLQWKDPKQYEYVVSGLLKAGRRDLIGDLVPNRGLPPVRKSGSSKKRRS
ncbi:Radical SAM N-terminal domain protein [Methanocorpusculum labreanum Z]|uniref:Radical SAM N-terminal domain protein n=1 Tax=Methanocorpusculum labreanum (strain ATCC 43576 / DSM 4855 / Z) TaxID=410358 RepID=A2STY7_METLZ|nr:YgiQ family radical SAM protein [Methanocorpusculum labreanum]ABN07793.1 Radical SAM N-terminal domain protein [Methanocorpusculum labreanum Z]